MTFRAMPLGMLDGAVINPQPLSESVQSGRVQLNHRTVQSADATPESFGGKANRAFCCRNFSARMAAGWRAKKVNAPNESFWQAMLSPTACMKPESVKLSQSSRCFVYGACADILNIERVRKRLLAVRCFVAVSAACNDLERESYTSHNLVPRSPIKSSTQSLSL